MDKLNITLLGDLKKKFENSMKRFREANKQYKDYLWEVGYSGGKDSIIVVHLLLVYLHRVKKRNSNLPRRVYILYSDTLLDIPVLRDHASKTLNLINNFCEKDRC